MPEGGSTSEVDLNITLPSISRVSTPGPWSNMIDERAALDSLDLEDNLAPARNKYEYDEDEGEEAQPAAAVVITKKVKRVSPLQRTSTASTSAEC